MYEAAVMAVEMLHDVYGCPRDAELQIKLRMEVWDAKAPDEDAAA